MFRLPMCRICLTAKEDVPAHLLRDKNLHKLYEDLTNIPFVTEDCRPSLVCVFCLSQLKQCNQFKKKCLEAENRFENIMMGEPYPLENQGRLEYYGGCSKSFTENIDEVQVLKMKSFDVKEKSPAICEGLDYNIINTQPKGPGHQEPPANCEGIYDDVQPKEDHQEPPTICEGLYDNIIITQPEELFQLELENLANSYLDAANIQPQVDLEDDIPSPAIITEVEDFFTNRTKGATVAKTQQEDAITIEQTQKEESGSKLIRSLGIPQKRTSIPGTSFKETYKSDLRSFTIKNHILTGEKPYKCNICTGSFSNKNALSMHILIHTGEKPFNCEICQRSFNRLSSLKRHWLIHTDIKPYQCDRCSRTFRHSYNLITHYRTHSGEKPYICNECNRSYTRRYTLTRHIRTRHNGK